MIKNNSPVENGSLRCYKYLSDLSAAATRAFICLGIFLLMSCGASHKIKSVEKQKESTVDKSTINEKSTTQINKHEKADTVVSTAADTATLKVFITDILNADEDTAATEQEIETDHLKIKIISKPVIVKGIKKGNMITATAIKKSEDLKIIIDKTTETNIEAQTKTKNDVVSKKTIKETNKKIDRSMSWIWWIIAAILIIVLLRYLYRKYVKVNL
jgi:hypothetical protein